MGEKKCSKCGVVKGLEEFGLHSAAKNIKSPKCKSCACEYAKKHYVNNKEKRLATIRKYRAENPEKQAAGRRRYRQANRNKCRASDKRRRETNKEERLTKRREWARAAYQRNLLFRATCRLRSRLVSALRAGRRPKEAMILQLFGTDFTTLQAHLIKTVLDKYGVYWFDEVYELDHVVPLSCAKSVSWLERLNHYSNLQLLTSQDNMDKSRTVDWPAAVQWIYSRRLDLTTGHG